jgi:ABC-type glycerol-3-phosphate transport system substrate-binding protein
MKKLLLFAAIALTFAACSKEQNAPAQKESQTVFFRLATASNADTIAYPIYSVKIK